MAKNKDFENIEKFISDHWNGKLTLARSFWLVGWVIAFIFVLPLLYASYNVANLSQAAVYFFLLYFVFYIAMAVWINVGIWRSATVYLKKKNAVKFYGYGAKVVVVIALFRTFGELLVSLLK